MKYMVMECRSAYAVVLAEDGRFLKVANLHYTEGQTVTEVTELKLPQTHGIRRKHWITTLAAVAACLALAVSTLFVTAGMPCASVYLTINPQVRIDVNRREKVVAVEGMNADGEDLLAGYDYSRKALDTVMDELVDRAMEMGYLHPGGKITLSLEADDRWVSLHEEQLGSHLQDHVTEDVTVYIDIWGGETAATVPEGTVVIPLDSRTDYGESDYGEFSDEDDDRGDDIDYDEDGDNHDDGQTDYGKTDYDRDEITENEKDSGYDQDGDFEKDQDSDYDGEDND